MELRHLRYFVAVAEELHFGRAAERIGIEQSPLSRAIRELEQDLDVRLFTRTSRNTRMTAAGAAFLPEAHRILDSVRNARSVARSVTAGLNSRFCIGVSPSIAQPRLARLLSRSRSEEPNVELRVVDRSIREQAAELRSGALDLALSPVPVNTDGLRSEPLWSDAPAALLPMNHPWAKVGAVPFGAFLRRSDVVCHGELQETWDALGATRDGCHVPGRRCVSVSSLAMLLELVAAGLALGAALARQLDALRRLDVVAIPFDASAPSVTTFATFRSGGIPAVTGRFLLRARALHDGAPSSVPTEASGPSRS